MRIVCWQTILMKYPTSFLSKKNGKMWQNLSSAAVVIGALRVNSFHAAIFCMPLPKAQGELHVL